MNLKIDLLKDWVELFAILSLVLGLLISLLLESAWMSYLTIIIAGFVAGRLYYLKRKFKPLFPFIFIIIGFLLGYLIGGFWVSKIALLVLFAAAAWLSYYLHKKQIIAIFKSEGFIK